MIKKYRVLIKQLLMYMRSSYILTALLIVLTFLLAIVMMGISACMKLYLDIASGVGRYTLTQVTALAIAVISMIGILQLGIGFIRAKIVCRTENAIRTSIITNVYQASYLDVEQMSESVYLTRLISDAQIISEYVPDVFVGYMMQEITMMILSMEFMFSLNKQLATLFCTVVPILIFAIVRISGGIQKQVKNVMTHEEECHRVMQQMLQRNILFRLYEMFQTKISELNHVYTLKSHSMTRLGLLKGVVEFFNNFMGIGLFVLALGVGTRLVLRNTITIGDVVAIVNLVSYLYGPFIHVTDWIAKTGEVKSAIDRIADIQMEVPQRQETALNISNVQKIDIRDLSFSYSDEKEILNGFSLTLTKGKIVGITGKNGCGKTTLTYLLCGLYPHKNGCFFADEQKIAGIRQQDIAYMPNKPQVFLGTIRENILMGLPYDEVRWEQVMSDSGLSDILETLPEGAETVMTEENGNFSSGQLQRINLARTFYRDALLYILDEPDSYLTPQAIMRLMDVLKERAKERMIIVISHEDTVLRECTECYCMEDGKLIIQSEAVR